MRKSIFILMTVCLFTSAFGQNSSKSQQKTLIFVMNNTNVKPYRWYEGDNIKGSDVDIIRELAKRLGIKIQFRPLPFKRLLANLKVGRYVGTGAIYKNEERAQYLHYVEVPFRWTNLKVYTKVGQEFSFNKISDLYGKTLGKNAGYSISDAFDQAEDEKKIIVSEGNKYENLLMMLLAGRLDGIVGIAEVIQYYITTMNLTDKIKVLPHSLRKPRPSYLVLSKKATTSQRFIDDIHRLMSEMAEDGTLQKITNKYGFGYGSSEK